MLNPQRQAFRVYLDHRYDLARFSMLFRLFEAFLFTPLAAIVGHWLSGQAVVDSTDLVGFVLSPRGALASTVAAILFLTIRLVEQTGLSAIALGAMRGERVTSPGALRVVLRVWPRVVSVAAWILLATVGLAVPLLVVGGWISHDLLARHDINYYLAERPPEFLKAIALLAVVAVPTVGAFCWYAIGWRFIVPVLLCEPLTARDVLRASMRLVTSHWRRTALAWFLTLALILTLGLIAAWLGRLCSLTAALLTADGTTEPAILFVGLLVVRTLLSGFITLPGPCVASAVFALLYRDFRRETNPEWVPDLGVVSHSGPASRWVAIGGWLLAALPVGMALISLITTVLGVGELDRHHDVAVTAHRGGTRHSIENTLHAIQEAIDDGAQFAEIDVQMSLDAVLVVTHDSDFSRQAGVARKVWELPYEEIRQIPLKSVEAPDIAADFAPRLDEVLELAKNQIRLNIELKYYGEHQPRLAERVVQAVRDAGMADQVVIQSLHYAGLEEVRRLAPGIPVGYLFSVNARNPERLDVNFLSTQLGRAKGSFIRAAHRRQQEVHVWTVDKPADMQRLIDLGVDNLITNRPREALEFAREHALLSPPQRALRQVRAWLLE
ncbi:MAG: glycerophosphoryl diester phosphodiesterase membrane domain-containing protein [Planctomycetes bacterium]|nr:glycerophosphoryl diester phosphodiesterase membrane domain-containing protein [Planctomycetota bacterium]